MSRARAVLSSCTVLLVVLALASGCGAPRNGEEEALREEAAVSLRNLGEISSLRFRLRLESWVGVSGQTVYGNEICEGSRTGEGFVIAVKRSTPVGEEEFTLLASGGRVFRREGGNWARADEGTSPHPLYDPLAVAGLAKEIQSATLEGEEERDGVSCRRLLARLDPACAGAILSRGAWSFYSNLHFELNLRLWSSESSAPPLSLQLEALGFDPAEGLLRYRLLATLDPYDLGDPDISLPRPE